MPTRAYIGAAAAWVDTVEAFGSGKLSVAEVLEPAIRLAKEGYSTLPSPISRLLTIRGK